MNCCRPLFKDLLNLKNVVSKICVAYVSEGDLLLIKIHNIEFSSRNITYFADDKTKKSFKANLAKERFSEVDESEEEVLNSSNLAMAAKMALQVTILQLKTSRKARRMLLEVIMRTRRMCTTLTWQQSLIKRLRQC